MSHRTTTDGHDRVSEIVAKLCGRYAANRGSIATHVPVPMTWLRDLYEATHEPDPDELTHPEPPTTPCPSEPPTK